jgi:hypothetical protein
MGAGNAVPAMLWHKWPPPPMSTCWVSDWEEGWYWGHPCGTGDRGIIFGGPDGSLWVWDSWDDEWRPKPTTFSSPFPRALIIIPPSILPSQVPAPMLSPMCL